MCERECKTFKPAQIQRGKPKIHFKTKEALMTTRPFWPLGKISYMRKWPIFQ